MSKILVLMILSVFSNKVISASLDLKLCYESFINRVIVTETQLSWNKITMPIKKTEGFVPGDLGRQESFYLSLAGISEYTSGLMIEAGDHDEVFLILNYGHNQKTGLLLGMLPFPLGRTEDCSLN